ncbi:MAG: peptidoglycan glycosyltransferase [Kouleothrix sp.]|jgi:penicillin-binding protein 2|nr:peptidoglycan glycosyltransferase [Kouleothrix sp.]
MNRLILPKLIVLLVLVALIGRLYQLQIVPDEADRYRDSTRTRTMRYLPVRPMRGEIFAADGTTLLAESVPIYTVSIRPADLPSAISAPAARDEVFSRLSQLLGISNTLTISPALALDQDTVLRNDLTQGLGSQVLAAAQRFAYQPPATLILAPDQRPAAAALVERERPTMSFAPPRQGRATTPSPDLVPITTSTGTVISTTSTLVISPAASLDTRPELRSAIVQALGQPAADAIVRPAPTAWVELTVPPVATRNALTLSAAYTQTLRLANPIADRVARANVPGYQTVPIKQDIPRELALVLRENAPSLPGVLIEQDFRRRYPLSGEIQSFSHLLGYINRVEECDLVRQNSARSWVGSLLESIGHAEECGLVTKQIRPDQLGIPRYLADQDRIGKDGLEASYEAELRGQLGWNSLLVDAAGRPVRAPDVVQPARDGNNLILTIDVPFQRNVEQILRNWIDISEQRRQSQSGAFAFKRDYKPIRSGVAIAMEVKTGRILAMASWPSYDNNIWGDPQRTSELQALLDLKNPDNRRLTPLLNRAVQLQYPPGSTLKQFDALVALQQGVITPQTIVHDPGTLVVENRFAPGVTQTYRNAGSRGYGDINVSDALLHSSNIFFMSVVGGNKQQVINLQDDQKNIPDGLNDKRFAQGMALFGLGQKTGVKLAGELPGRVPTPAWKQKVKLEAWTTGDLYNAAIGQGDLEVTPLQLINGSVAVANGGTLFRPQIVKAITDTRGKLVREVAPEPLRTIAIDPAYYDVVRQGMRRSVTEGVNRAARDECSGLQIAGKTGTAEFGPEITLPLLNGKPRLPVRQSHSWFVGFAPYDNPQIEVLVLVEGSGDMNDGSATIAVPAVTQIMQAYFKLAPPNPLPRGCQTDLPPLPGSPAPTLAAQPPAATR